MSCYKRTIISESEKNGTNTKVTKRDECSAIDHV